MRFQGQTLHFLGPLVGQFGGDALVPAPFADPFLHLAVPAEAVVGLAVFFGGSFRPYAALAPSFALAAFLYWLLALAFFLLVGLRGRRGLVAAHRLALSRQRCAQRCSAAIDTAMQ